MAMKFCVARNARGTIITYGRGVTDKIAEGHCREWAETYEKRKGPFTYEPFTMPKPKFKKGQKIRKIGISQIRKVLAVGDTPLLAGFIVARTINIPGFGAARMWENEKEFEAVEAVQKAAA